MSDKDFAALLDEVTTIGKVEDNATITTKTDNKATSSMEKKEAKQQEQQTSVADQVNDSFKLFYNMSDFSNEAESEFGSIDFNESEVKSNGNGNSNGNSDGDSKGDNEDSGGSGGSGPVAKGHEYAFKIEREKADAPYPRSYRRRLSDNRIVRVMKLNEDGNTYKCSLVNPCTPDLSPVYQNLSKNELSTVALLLPSKEDYILAKKLIEENNCRNYQPKGFLKKAQEKAASKAHDLIQGKTQEKADQVFDMLAKSEIRGYNGLNWCKSRGESIFYCACESNCNFGLRHLLFEGLVDFDMCQKKDKYTPFMMSVTGTSSSRHETVSMLLTIPDSILDLNRKEWRGCTILYYASVYKPDLALELLLPSDNGIPYINDLDEETIKSKGYKVGIDPLVRHTDNNQTVYDEFKSGSYRSKPSFEYLKWFGGDESFPPLHACVMENKIQYVKQLLELGK